MVTIDQIEKGLAAYLDKELMPLIPEAGFQRVLIGTGIGLAIRRNRGRIDELKSNPVVKMLGIFDETGTKVDLDAIREELSKQIVKEGFKIEVPTIGNLTFHKEDIDKLYNYIVNSSVGR